jgi:hypothetical protein
MKDDTEKHVYSYTNTNTRASLVRDMFGTQGYYSTVVESHDILNGAELTRLDVTGIGPLEWRI